MSKKKRLIEIVNLIENNEIDTQEELTAKLIERGFEGSQATVSRDINDLGLIKCAGRTKKFKYCKPIPIDVNVSETKVAIFKQVVESITQASNLIVIKTHEGSANSVGSVVDCLHLPQILGTIAGDDTLLIVAKDVQDAELVVKSLRTL